MIADPKENLRRRLVYERARERDREAWLAEGAKVSLEEHTRRDEIVKAARAEDPSAW